MSKIHDFLSKNLGVEATLETASAWFADRDRQDLEFTAPQVSYILKHFDPAKECYHMHVKIHTRKKITLDYFQPDEYEAVAECEDCGDWVEVEDVPDVADRRDA